MATVNKLNAVVSVVQDAGGRIVGRTRLQKIGYLLEAAGLGTGFEFEYRHYGPYSDDLANAARTAAMFNLLKENELPASWGGRYSVYEAEPVVNHPDTPRAKLISEAAHADAVALELAATALFLAQQGVLDPWAETQRRKPEKADGRLANAKALYERLRQVQTPVALPPIAELSFFS